MTDRYFDPKNDVAFKKLFGTEDKKPLLKEFLNAILDLKGDREIVDLTYLPQEEIPILPDQKKGIVDVRCQDAAGHIFIVEMQNKSIPEYAKRVQFYGAHAYVSQLLRGEAYLELRPVIILAVTNYIEFPDKDPHKPITYHKILDTDTFENDLDAISYAFLELPKFHKNSEECHTLQEKWIYFFGHVAKEHEPAFDDPNILKAYDTMEQFNWTSAEQLQYIHAANIAVGDAEIERLKFEEGRIEGKIEVARALCKAGVSAEIITETTGLTTNEWG